MIVFDPANDAWLVREAYQKGRFQTDIADEIGTSSSRVGTRIVSFCRQWASKNVIGVYGSNRRMIALAALGQYIAAGGKIEEPRPAQLDFSIADLALARGEYATMCRAESETWARIGKRLGVGTERARQIQAKFARRMRKAMQRTRVIILPEEI